MIVWETTDRQQSSTPALSCEWNQEIYRGEKKKCHFFQEMILQFDYSVWPKRKLIRLYERCLIRQEVCSNKQNTIIRFWVNIITVHPVLKAGYTVVAILFCVTFAAILYVKIFYTVSRSVIETLRSVN